MNSNRQPSALVGNRIALTGAVLFLLEWVAIFGSGLVGVRQLGADSVAPLDQVVSTYAGAENGLALVAGWMAIVLAGRVLFVVGLRAALDASGWSHPLMSFATITMAISVVLETAAIGLYSAAAKLAADGFHEGVVAVDRAGTAISTCLFGALGLAVLTASWCMWRSRLFPRALSGLGVAGGAGFLVMQLISGPALRPLSEALYATVPLLLFVWMVWTGIRLWRRAQDSTAEDKGRSGGSSAGSSQHAVS